MKGKWQLRSYQKWNLNHCMIECQLTQSAGTTFHRTERFTCVRKGNRNTFLSFFNPRENSLMSNLMQPFTQWVKHAYQLKWSIRRFSIKYIEFIIYFVLFLCNKSCECIYIAITAGNWEDYAFLFVKTDILTATAVLLLFLWFPSLFLLIFLHGRVIR